MAQNGTVAYVTALPECDFCAELTRRVVARRQAEEVTVTKAQFDFKTKHGPWAMGCPDHYRVHRAYRDLGVGKGQKLEVRPVAQEVGS